MEYGSEGSHGPFWVNKGSQSVLLDDKYIIITYMKTFRTHGKFDRCSMWIVFYNALNHFKIIRH